MKQFAKNAALFLLAASCVAPACAKGKDKVAEAREAMKVPKSNYTLYLPGKGSKKSIADDFMKQGFLVSDTVADHFSLLQSNLNKKNVLLFDTTEDNMHDAIILPLSGNEKRVTVIFKASGAFDPDTVKTNDDGSITGTPYGMFYGYVQKGENQTLLRHNSSNQVKGSKGTSRLTVDGTGKTPKIDIVSDWHDFRFVFNTENPEEMTAEAYIDGKKWHEDKCKKISSDSNGIDWVKLNGTGNYLEFGDNDGSTKAFARYAYILVVRDDDVSEMSLDELGKKVKANLSDAPEITNNRGPKSKRPDAKPASLNMTADDFPMFDEFTDASAIEGEEINLDALPYSKNAAQKVVRGGIDISAIEFAATVDKSGANGAYKTIAEAIDAVGEGSAIKIMPGLYKEKLVITKRGISLIGTDPAKTVIYGFEADAGDIDSNLLVEVNYMEKGKSPAYPAANCYFNAANITFYNKGAEWNKAWGGAERRSITLALKGVDTSVLENCVFIAQQDTLYWRSGRVYAHNCYIEGDVDFICGGATVLFDECHIHSIPYGNSSILVAAAGADTGYASTAEYANGYVFRDCIITADKKFDDAKDGAKVTLARGSWQGGSSEPDVSAKTVFLNTEFAGAVNSALWADWDTVNTADKAFFRVYGAKGAGAEVIGERNALSSDDYAAHYDSTEKILGFTPVLK